jgi:nickel-dependent lactate racemase
VIVSLAYGESRLDVALPASTDVTVVEPTYRSPVADPLAVLRAAMRAPIASRPLRELVAPGQTVAISICDGTRPQPREVMLTAVLEELEGIVRLDDVTVLVATGTHRGNSPEELRSMLGDLLDTVRVVNHDGRDEGQLQWLGWHDGDVPVWLNRRWLEADVRVTTGFVEPHFFAGFSGGPKMVAPGLAGLATVLALHNAARIGSDRATWGVIEGNPVHDSIRSLVDVHGRVDFALDVALNRDQAIVAAFAGALGPMHRAATEMVRGLSMQPVPGRFDVVLTSNSGYPLDQNLYQAVKGMSAAAQVVKPGGTIVCAAECRDGFPDHGSYRQLLASAATPADVLRSIERAPTTIPDQWQAQIQARIQAQARVLVHSSFLSDDELAEAHFESAADLDGTLAGLLDGRADARACVLPEGPQTIAYSDGQ